jgi:hypothetical protein
MLIHLTCLIDERIIIQGALSRAAISQLLQRCRFIMETYLADAQLRGSYPFSRYRVFHCNYCNYY